MNDALPPERLWEGAAPGSPAGDEGDGEIVTRMGGDDGQEWIRNVAVPTLTAYLPDDIDNPADPDRAVLVLPGGALRFVSMSHEGTAVGELLRAQGIAAFVLKYRVETTPVDAAAFLNDMIADIGSGNVEDVMAAQLPLSVADAARAMEIIRARGYEHVTALGFSAGARITAELVLRGTGSQVPDAAGFVYLPTVSECIPPEHAPPLFISAAVDDMLGVEGSIDAFQAWRGAGHPVELHLFEKGGHGFGLPNMGLGCDLWPELFLRWYRSLDSPAVVPSVTRT